MAKYPFAVFFTEETTATRVIVRANDTQKAVRQAVRETYPDAPAQGFAAVTRVANLTPRQRDGQFLPRIDGVVVSSDLCPTQDDAVEAALRFLAERAASR